MSAPINTAPREGWRNRHTDPMPTEACNIMVLHHEGGEIVGRWLPNEDNTERAIIGTILCIGHHYPYGKYGLHAWRGKNYEFTYYKVL